MKIFGLEVKREPKSRHNYKVGLALSGGGARGFAHAGAIEAMMEVGLKPDLICGVSAGSVVAVMHAAGIPPRRMLEMFSELKFGDLASWNIPKEGLFRLDKFKDFLKEAIPYRYLEELPLPTVVCATNFDTGHKIAFTHGLISEVVAASCCIPIVFNPIQIGRYRYVDGGVLANLPAWAIREKCEFLVGVNVSPATSVPVKDNLLNIAMRSYELMAKNNALSDMELCDMLIKTDEIARYKVFDLKNITRVFDSGYRTTMDYFAGKGIAPAKREKNR